MSKNLCTINCHLTLKFDRGSWELFWTTPGYCSGSVVHHTLATGNLYIVADKLKKLEKEGWCFVTEERDVNPDDDKDGVVR